VATQYPTAGYFIDMVVRDKAGRRLGIECDGQFHYDELGQLREEDFERQEILERAGWPIHRIPARRYFLNPEEEIRTVLTILSSLASDEEMFQLEHEDLAPMAKQDVDVLRIPEPIQIPRSLSSSRPMIHTRQADRAKMSQSSSLRPSTQSYPPPFSNADPWIDASRWARIVGHWTLANRVFLWEFGDQIRNGKQPSESDRLRAAALWSDAQREGYQPKTDIAS
jgi:hypothetical protein